MCTRLFLESLGTRLPHSLTPSSPHPFTHSPPHPVTPSPPHRLTHLQVSALGCTSFFILFDDIEPDMCPADDKTFPSFAHAQVAVANELYCHLSKPSVFLFCPTGLSCFIMQGASPSCLLCVIWHRICIPCVIFIFQSMLFFPVSGMCKICGTETKHSL